MRLTKEHSRNEATAVEGDRASPPTHFLLRHSTRAAVLVSLAYAATLFSYAVGARSLTPDAADYADVARSLVRGQGYTTQFVEFHPGLFPAIRHPPELHGLLQPLLIAPGFATFGPGNTLALLPSIVAVAALLLVTYVMTLRIFGVLAAWIALGLVLTDPMLGADAVLGGDDVGFAALAGLAMLFMVPERASDPTQTRRVAILGAGICTALAVLQKFNGVVLPLAFGAGLFSYGAPGASTGELSKRWAVVAGFGAFAVAAYLLRNHAVHGGLGFRFGALDWLSRDSPGRYFAFHERAPKLRDVLESLGPRAVLRIFAEQLEALVDAIGRSPWLLLGGPVALVLHLRRQRTFAVTSLVYCASTAMFLCAVYHVEGRYLLGVYPVCAAAVGGVVRGAAARFGRGSGAAKRWFGRGVVATALLMMASNLRGLSHAVATFAGAEHAPLACAAELSFLRTRLSPDAAVLAAVPSFVGWLADRPAVRAPTNGDDALLRVLRAYHVKWVFVGAEAFDYVNLDESLARLARAGRVSSKRQLTDGACRIYRVSAR